MTWEVKELHDDASREGNDLTPASPTLAKVEPCFRPELTEPNTVEAYLADHPRQTTDRHHQISSSQSWFKFK